MGATAGGPVVQSMSPEINLTGPEMQFGALALQLAGKVEPGRGMDFAYIVPSTLDQVISDDYVLPVIVLVPAFEHWVMPDHPERLSAFGGSENVTWCHGDARQALNHMLDTTVIPSRRNDLVPTDLIQMQIILDQTIDTWPGRFQSVDSQGDGVRGKAVVKCIVVFANPEGKVRQTAGFVIVQPV